MKKSWIIVGSLVVVIGLIVGYFYISGGFDNKIDYEETKVEQLSIQSKDGLMVTADVRLINNYSPIVLLYHQAYMSRGEYQDIAPRLNELGYNTMAVDLRSGFRCFETINETAMAAREGEFDNSRPAAVQDARATIEYAISELAYSDVITWGSSYSSGIVLGISEEYKDNVVGVLAFSPGESVSIDGIMVREKTSQLSLPVFISGKQAEEPSYRNFYNAVPHENKTIFVPVGTGWHGSKSLWKDSEGNEEYWEAVGSFLESVTK